MKYNLSKSFLIFLLLLTSTIQYCLSQNITDQEISQLTYEEIKASWLAESEKYNNTYFNLHVAKAKKEKDTLELARAHRYRAWNLPMEEGLKSVDSAMVLVNSIKKIDSTVYNKFISLAFYTKGGLYFSNHEIEKATEELIKSFHLAKRANYKEIIIQTLSNLSYMKAENGQEQEALLLQKRVLDFAEENQTAIFNYNEYYLSSITTMAFCHLFAKNTDSAKTYSNKAIKLAIEINQEPDYEEMIVLNAQADYYDGHHYRARDTLIKYLEKESGTVLADRYFYLGMIEGKLGESDLKKKYFISIDSVMKSMEYPLIDNMNQVYQFLLKDAIDNNEHNKEQEFFEKLVYYDSLLERTQQRLREITLEKLDLPLREEEKKELTSAIASRDTLIKIFYVTSSLLLLGLFGYYLRYRNTKKRLQHIMQHPIELENRLPNAETKLDKAVFKEILEKLNAWENEKGFLDTKLTQHTLAKALNTNSTYLSQAINTNKGHNFSSYLKDLRITYAINELKRNPDIAKTKSIIQIAELYGFNSLAVFSKALKAKIGVAPGAFIKQVEKANSRS